MAEEDVIFGKNKHLFGGIEPSNMQTFIAQAAGGLSIDIIMALPKDTVIDGQTICTVAGVVIRKSTEGYPETEFDGEFVADVTSDGVITDIVSEIGVTVYYSAFPYSDQGVYTRNVVNRTSAEATEWTYLYGYDLDTTDPDPSTRVSYPDDVFNRVFNPAHMDYNTGVFDYGHWPSAPGEKFMPRPCMLNFDGTVAYYLKPNDYSKKEDGTAISSGDYNAMMEWPKIYTKRWEENGVYHFRCSDVKIDDDWDCWCNYDGKNNEIDHFYTAIYIGCDPSNYGRLRSLSGQPARTDIDYKSYIQRASSNWVVEGTPNNDWCIDVLADRLLIQDLLVMISKTTDSQTAFGLGVLTYTNSGSMDTKGMFWGSNEEGQGVKVFGMEHWWGAKNRFLAGVISTTTYAGGRVYLKYKITRGTHDGSSVTEYNTTGDGYKILWNVSSSIAKVGYIGATTAVGSYGRIPSAADGSVTTCECDYMNISVYASSINPSAVYPLAVGAPSGAGGQGVGLFSIGNEAALSKNTTNIRCVACLSCKPSAN